MHFSHWHLFWHDHIHLDITWNVNAFVHHFLPSFYVVEYPRIYLGYLRLCDVRLCCSGFCYFRLYFSIKFPVNQITGELFCEIERQIIRFTRFEWIELSRPLAPELFTR